MTARTTAPLALLAATAVALPACGGDDKKPASAATTPAQAAVQLQKVRATVGQLAAASRAGDTKQICTTILTPRLAKVIASHSKAKDCEAAARKSLVSPREQITIQSVTVNGTTARATVREQNGNRSLLGLVQQGGSWRIDGLQALPKQ